MLERLSLERELERLGLPEFTAGSREKREPNDWETTDLHALHDYQIGPASLPVQKVFVKDWINSLNVSSVKVTAAVIPNNVKIKSAQPVNPLAFDRPTRMSILAGERGQVGLRLKIEYKGIGKIPRSSRVAQDEFALRNLPLDFSCTAEGNIRLNRKLPARRTHARTEELGIDLEIYQRKDKPKNSPMRGIPPSVWDEWMKMFSIVRIVVIARLTVTKGGPGWFTLDVKDESVPIPASVNAGSTGPYTALLGPMTIDLVPEGARPPITAKQGLLHDVYFGVNSSEIDKIVGEGPDGRIHQGNKLDAWLRDNLIARWDVREALLRGDLPVRGEARASATLKGKSRQDLLRYNQALSERRRDAVVNRLKSTLSQLDKDIRLDATQLQITAIGASKAPSPGEENVIERRCRIGIDAADLEAVIKKLYKEPHRHWWDR